MSDTFNASKAIIAFYNDENFQKIKQYYERTTIFNVLKIERNENRHSAFICWLLDIHGSHQLGEEPLRKFLRTAANKTTNEDVRNRLIVGNYKIEDFYINTEESVAKNKKVGRIDIYIKFIMVYGSSEEGKTIPIQVIVENKIYTSEHDEQTKLYYEWALDENKKHNPDENGIIIGVFLSPELVEKCDGDCEDFTYAKMDYETLLYDVIEPLLGSEMTSDTEHMISDYIVNLGKPAKPTNEDGTPKEKALNDILAITRENQQILNELFKKNKELLVAALDSNEGDFLNSFLNQNKLYMQLLFDNLDSDSEILTEERKAKIRTLLGIGNKKRMEFKLNGRIVKGKGSLVLAIVNEYVKENPSVTEAELMKEFNENVFEKKILLREGLVITPKDKTESDTANIDDYGCNYFLDENDVITLNDGEKVVVWRYWPDRFFKPFIENVKIKLGYNISE